jgi:proteasome ATPase
MVNITSDEIRKSKHFLKKKINGARFKLEELIDKYEPTRKVNAKNVYQSIEDFFAVQEIAYGKIQSQLNTTESLALSTIIAADYARETLDHDTAQKEVFFNQINLNLGQSQPYYTTDLMTGYCRSLTEIFPKAQLEVLTSSFFDWADDSASKLLEGKDEKIKSLFGDEYQIGDNKFKYSLISKKKIKKTASSGVNGNEVSNSDKMLKSVEWSEIGGLDKNIAKLRKGIERPFLYPDKYEFYKKEKKKGSLLYGPPGCGKTLVAKALITEMKKNDELYGGFNLIYVNGPEILNKYLGESERAIRDLFSEGRANEGKTLIFFDEAEALFPKRGSRKSSDADSTIVPQFLSEVDGLNGGGDIYVLLATNKENSLDSAVTRPGRIDQKYFIPRPNQEGLIDIASLYLSEIPVHEDCLNQYGDECNTHFVNTLVENILNEDYVITHAITEKGTIENIYLKDIVSGGLVNDIVEKATDITLDRDIETGVIGLTEDDIIRGVYESYLENINITNEVSDYPPERIKEKIVEFINITRDEVFIYNE